MSVLVGRRSHARRLHNHIIDYPWKQLNHLLANTTRILKDNHQKTTKTWCAPPVTKKYERSTNENVVIAEGAWSHVGFFILMFGISRTEKGRANNPSIFSNLPNLKTKCKLQAPTTWSEETVCMMMTFWRFSCLLQIACLNQCQNIVTSLRIMTCFSNYSEFYPCRFIKCSWL